MKNKQTSSTFKFLATIGFIAIIIIIAWLSIQLVNLAPNAFSSLASLRESMNQQADSIMTDDELETLTVTSDTSLINNEGLVNLAWNTVSDEGTYTFSYACANGLSLTIKDSASALKDISCDTNYNIGDVDQINVEVASVKERFADVSYTVSFLGMNDTEPRASGNSSFTVINRDIPEISLAGDPEPEELESEDKEEFDETNQTQPEDEITGQTTDHSNSQEPVYEQEFIYAIPTSDPNGLTDLAVRYLFAGEINGDSFTPGAIPQNDDGAIQFEVRNLGTKTSGEWTYTMSLPNGNQFKSEEQDPLKPNETATITIGFPTTNEDDFTCNVSVDAMDDRNSTNDEFSQSVNFF